MNMFSWRIIPGYISQVHATSLPSPPPFFPYNKSDKANNDDEDDEEDDDEDDDDFVIDDKSIDELISKIANASRFDPHFDFWMGV